MNHRNLVPVFLLAICASSSPCQETSLNPAKPAADAGPAAQPRENGRILGIIPNYRTFPSLKNYTPLTTREKFKIASEDAFDRGTVLMGAAFGGLGQLTNANRPFGQGVAGYSRYFGASYGDLVIGDYMTEAIFPTLLHQDPRYFRRGSGSGWSRVGYAASQIFRTHRDSGGTQFNYSELLGNSAAVAISNAYYSDNRTAGNAVSKLGMQLGVDMFGNVLKEFWPDLQRKFRRKPALRNPSN
ncbi:MAG TPA: hypothetical protein VMS37_23280 [Verrucomicrobiae bacterium]|nr:hypothetical protein [Verrucomicrobiae bacterium]